MMAVGLLAAAPAAADPGLPLYTGSLPQKAEAEANRPLLKTDRGHLIVLGFGGDLGFSSSGDAPSAEGSVKHGLIIPWDRLTSAIAPLLAADANFANLETVISASRSLVPIEKSYTFLGDPAGLRHTVASGITVLTAANNHAGDFGPDGIVETLGYLSEAKANGLKAFAGIGIGAARYRASTFDVKGSTIGVAAIGLAINHAEADGPGQPLYASQPDFDRVTGNLAETDADIRVLSVHYGLELVSFPGERDMSRFRRAIDSGAASIVFGHHAHVPSGIEYRHGGLILYGLGNFMHSGTQDVSRYGACRDFGIYAKAYIWSEAGQPPVIRALEVFPIRGMHAVPQTFPEPEAARRISIVNALNAAVSDARAAPVRLEPTRHASGLACFGDQSRFADELAARCNASAGPLQQSSLTQASALATCGKAPPPGAATQLAEEPPPVPKARPLQKTTTKTTAAAEKQRVKSPSAQKLLD